VTVSRLKKRSHSWVVVSISGCGALAGCHGDGPVRGVESVFAANVSVDFRRLKNRSHLRVAVRISGCGALAGCHGDGPVRGVESVFAADVFVDFGG